MKNNFLIIATLTLFITYGIEEYVTSFQTIDPLFTAAYTFLKIPLNHNVSFIIFQIAVWIAISYILFTMTKKNKVHYAAWFMTAFALFELHHIFEAITRQSYYPGLITSFFFPITACAWWLHAHQR